MKGYRTTFFNILMLLLALADLTTALLPQSPFDDQARVWIAFGIAIVTGVGNIVLRIWFTDTSFGVKGFVLPRALVPIAALAALLLLLAGSTGCAALRPDADPYLTRAEQTLDVSVATLDALFLLERQNQAAMEQALPGTHAKVEKLRQEAPKAIQAAILAITAYRQVKSLTAKAEVDASLAAVQVKAAEAQKIMADSQGKEVSRAHRSTLDCPGGRRPIARAGHPPDLRLAA